MIKSSERIWKRKDIYMCWVMFLAVDIVTLENGVLYEVESKDYKKYFTDKDNQEQDDFIRNYVEGSSVVNNAPGDALKNTHVEDVSAPEKKGDDSGAMETPQELEENVPAENPKTDNESSKS